MTVLDAALIQALSRELESETDAARALRKALLGLIFLVQEEASTDLTLLIDYLLLAFPALSQHFEDERHPFVGNHAIKRVRGPDRASVLLHEEFLWQTVRDLVGDDSGN